VARAARGEDSIRSAGSLHNCSHYNCAATDYSSHGAPEESSPNEATVFDLM